MKKMNNKKNDKKCDRIPTLCLYISIVSTFQLSYVLQLTPVILPTSGSKTLALKINKTKRYNNSPVINMQNLLNSHEDEKQSLLNLNLNNVSDDSYFRDRVHLGAASILYNHFFGCFTPLGG